MATETVELGYQQLLAIVLQATAAVEAHGKELELLHGQIAELRQRLSALERPQKGKKDDHGGTRLAALWRSSCGCNSGMPIAVEAGAEGLILASIELAMFAHIRRAGTRLGEGFDLGVGQESLLLLGRAWEINTGRDVAGQASLLDGHVDDQ